MRKNYICVLSDLVWYKLLFPGSNTYLIYIYVLGNVYKNFEFCGLTLEEKVIIKYMYFLNCSYQLRNSKVFVHIYINIMNF